MKAMLRAGEQKGLSLVANKLLENLDLPQKKDVSVHNVTVTGPLWLRQRCTAIAGVTVDPIVREACDFARQYEER